MEEVQLSLYANNMILYIENPNDLTQKIIRADINYIIILYNYNSHYKNYIKMNLARYQDTRSTYRDWLHFFTLTVKYQEGNINKQYLLKTYSRR